MNPFIFIIGIISFYLLMSLPKRFHLTFSGRASSANGRKRLYWEHLSAAALGLVLSLVYVLAYKELPDLTQGFIVVMAIIASHSAELIAAKRSKNDPLAQTLKYTPFIFILTANLLTNSKLLLSFLLEQSSVLFVGGLITLLFVGLLCDYLFAIVLLKSRPLRMLLLAIIFGCVYFLGFIAQQYLTFSLLMHYVSALSIFKLKFSNKLGSRWLHSLQLRPIILIVYQGFIEFLNYI